MTRTPSPPPLPCALACAMACLLAAGPAAGQEAEPGAGGGDRSLRALPLDQSGVEGEASIRVDGHLDEAAWRQAPSASDFRQRNPDEGEPATEPTSVRVAYGEEALYVAVRARDSRPDRVIARILERDRVMRAGGFGGLRFRGDDGVALLLNPFHDHRNGIVFATNPNGAKFDALVTDQGQQINVEWRAVWQVEARRTADGWSAEFRLPFRSLRYPSGGGRAAPQTWGFNVLRVIRRKNEQALWSSWSRESEGLVRVSRAGHLTGLADLPRSGLNLEVEPYALAGATEERTQTASPADTRLETGLTAKYEIRPGLVLDLTANPDFAQVEVDREQVNLTRFSLFFPEKRDFFLENAGIFDFGQRGFGPQPPPFLLFFSRRIGFSPEGTVPLIGGARLTGRVGDQTVGVLDAVTDEAHGRPRTNYGVARVKRDVGENGYVGAMVTDLRRFPGTAPGGSTGAGGSGEEDGLAESNTAGGMDWSLWAGDRLNLRGFAAATTTEGPGGDDAAYRMAADYTGDLFGFFLGHLFVGPDANAGMGFVTRSDIRRSDAFLRLRPRPDVLGLRSVTLGLSGELFTDEAWTVRDWELGPFVSPEWDSGESMRLSWDRTFTRLEAPFQIADEVTVPAGDYDNWRLSGSFSTSSNRPVWGRIRGEYRRLYEGTLIGAGGALNLRVGKHLGVGLQYRHNDVEVPRGSFESDVLSARLRWALSTDLTGDAVVQYNSLEDRLFANVRVRLIHRPGSDLFVVFSEERGPLDGPGTAPVLTPGRDVPATSARPGPDPWRPPGGPAAGFGARWGTAPGIPARPAAGPDGGSLWDLRSRGAVVKLTYLLRI